MLARWKRQRKSASEPPTKYKAGYVGQPKTMRAASLPWQKKYCAIGLFNADTSNNMEQKMNQIIRQGDVLVIPCEKIPATAAPVEAENGRLILARGEATGHHHSIALHPRIAMFRDDASGGRLYIKNDVPAPLEHQEHTALTIQPGTHEVRIQRTVHSGMARRVAD